MSDGELLSKLMTDSTAALTELKNTYSAYVYAIMRDKLAAFPSEDIEEAVSDVFVRLWKNAEKIDLSRGSLKAYICVLAKSTALRKREQLMRSRGTVPLSEAAEIADKDSIERRSELKAMLMALPKQERELIVCRYYYGLHFKEIAARFNISEAAARKRTERILKKLARSGEESL